MNAGVGLLLGLFMNQVLNAVTHAMQVNYIMPPVLQESDLKETDWWGKVDSISTNTIVTGVPIKAGPITVEKNGAGAIVFVDNSESSSPPASSITACIAAAEAADAAASGLSALITV
eukprot:SAG31_NODE_1410_length_8470_cov_6.064031_4_plen_117_part_00